jgi:tetratricopeptide (TPR) repeat protein
MPDEARYMELFTAGCKLAEGLLRLDKQDLPHLGFFAKRRLKKAISHFESAAVESPDNAAPFLMLAKVEQRFGNNVKSLEWLQKAWALEPGNLILIVELSGALGLVGQHHEAILVLLEGIKYYPDEPRIHFNLGLSYLLDGQLGAAIEVLAKTVELEPDYDLNSKILRYAKAVEAGLKPLPKHQGDIVKNIWLHRRSVGILTIHSRGTKIVPILLPLTQALGGQKNLSDKVQPSLGLTRNSHLLLPGSKRGGNWYRPKSVR